MPEPDEIRDPRAFRWVESGVSGLAPPREWDASALADVAALRGSDSAELEFRVLSDGSVLGDVPLEALPALTADLGLEPPYAARAVRRGDTEWAVAARQLGSDPVALPGDPAAASLEVALPPGGEPAYAVDGEQLAEPPAGAEGEALAELERAGRRRFQAFVARADRVEDGRWDVTVDPL